MIDRRLQPATRDAARDERSMRIMEYAMAVVAIASAVLLSIR
jgi:hypothetical protein